MIKFNRKLIKGTNWALAGLMSFLGFASCEIGGGAVEYGTPHANYVVSGKVTDPDGKALAGISVAAVSEEDCYAGRPYNNEERVIPEEYRMNINTNSKGEFVYTYTGWPADTVKIKMKFDDKLNNTYKTDSTTVVFPKSELKGGKGGWNNGEAKKSIDIKLKRKDSE